MKVVALTLALGVAVVAVLLAQDLRAWPHALAHDRAASTALPFSAAERILEVRDQLALRRALIDARTVAREQINLTTSLEVQGRRASVENELGALAASSDARVASEAEDMLGFFSFGDLAHGGYQGRPQAETALAAFQNAVRLDPTNSNARWNLEVVLRLLIAHGVRTGPGQGAGGATGRHGASGGVPGRGF